MKALTFLNYLNSKKINLNVKYVSSTLLSRLSRYQSQGCPPSKQCGPSRSPSCGRRERAVGYQHSRHVARHDDRVVAAVVFCGRNPIVDKLGSDDALPLPLALLLLALYRRAGDAHQVPTYLADWQMRRGGVIATACWETVTIGLPEQTRKEQKDGQQDVIPYRTCVGT